MAMMTGPNYLPLIRANRPRSSDMDRAQTRSRNKGKCHSAYDRHVSYGTLPCSSEAGMIHLAHAAGR